MKTYINLLFSCLFVLTCFELSYSQVDARMLRYPDVSETQITFVYAGDIWVVAKEGGTAHKLSSPEGVENFPKFSPDGSSIAFTGNYDGNSDVYLIPTAGGLPKRLTWHGGNDRVLDWHPNGQDVLFASSRESGRQRFNQFYLISGKGGQASKLSVPYGEFASFSPDGKRIAYTDKSRVFRTWKRYRGGTAPDIFTFDLGTYQHANITSNNANDELPMWHPNNRIYYLSDRGEDLRYNLFEYNMATGKHRQLTDFDEFDIHFPSMGPEDIVFEAGGKLFLYSIADDEYHEVEIDVVTDKMSMAARREKVGDLVRSATISPEGNRAIVEARGELFSVPAEKGYVKNITQSSGVAERYHAWSPDGRKVAFWSDESGEYELTVIDMKDGTQSSLTDYGPGFRYDIFWSPDGEKLAFVDQAMKIYLYDTEADETTAIGEGRWMTHGGLSGFSVSWSHDSRYVAYSVGLDNRNDAVFIYDLENGETRQLTSGYYSDQNPVFDPDGKYLYVITNRNLQPVYSDMDYAFVYPNSSRIAAFALRKDVESPLAPENDEAAIEGDESEDDEKDGEKEDKEKEDERDGEVDGEGDEEAKEKEDEELLQIDFEGFEQRMILLPPDAGNMNMLHAVSGKVIYQRFPNSGSGDRDVSIKYYDLEKREEKTIASNARLVEISSDGKKMLVSSGNRAAIIDIAADQKMDKTLPLDDLEMTIDPKEEWVQIFNDAWRLERDYFYDPNMHGVDWKAVHDQYSKLLDDAVTRWDLNFILGEMIGEINASHTYRGGGDAESAEQISVGYLGVDWEAEGDYYRIDRIIDGAPWDAEERSPLKMPGVDVNEGDYVLAVNGEPLRTETEPYAAFQGLGGETVELTVSDEPDGEKRNVIVELMRSESRLRHLNWIESNRKAVDEATDGRVGYIYVRSTGIDGQNELMRQFAGQWHKEGLIVDERFNSGGQIPDRFVELLDRKPFAYFAVRDGKDWQWPPIGNFGPKAMLINGWSGSGGDAFPDYFRKAGLGPLIGSRTWGGLIGISGVPPLIDGGAVTVPTFRMYNPDGQWFREGHGVDPDIEVMEDPTTLAKGTDTQLQRAIDYIMSELDKGTYRHPQRPAYEDRSRP